MGGQIITYPGAVGSNIVECFVPPRGGRSGGGSVPSIGGGGGALGGAAAILGLGAALLEQADRAGIFDSSPSASSTPAPIYDGRPQYSADTPNAPLFAAGRVPSQPAPPANDLAQQLAADPNAFAAGRRVRYDLVGVLADPALARQIIRACNGQVEFAQLACVSNQITEALIQRLPAATEQCGPMVEPFRGICAARVNWEANRIADGECYGQCPIRVRVAARLFGRDQEAERTARPE